MAKEGDMSLYQDVLEPFRRVINTDPPKEKLSASAKMNFTDSNQSIKEGKVKKCPLVFTLESCVKNLSIILLFLVLYRFV